MFAGYIVFAAHELAAEQLIVWYTSCSSPAMGVCKNLFAVTAALCLKIRPAGEGAAADIVWQQLASELPSDMLRPHAANVPGSVPNVITQSQSAVQPKRIARPEVASVVSDAVARCKQFRCKFPTQHSAAPELEIDRPTIRSTLQRVGQKQTTINSKGPSAA